MECERETLRTENNTQLIERWPMDKFQVREVLKAIDVWTMFSGISSNGVFIQVTLNESALDICMKYKDVSVPVEKDSDDELAESGEISLDTVTLEESTAKSGIECRKYANVVTEKDSDDKDDLKLVENLRGQVRSRSELVAQWSLDTVNRLCQWNFSKIESKFFFSAEFS